MDLRVALDLLDGHLKNEPKLREVQRAHDDVAGEWMLDEYRAEVTPAGSTGLELRLSVHGRAIHDRIFASSSASVPRIAQAIIEHLTGYRK